MARKRAKSMDQRSFGRSFWTVDAARAPGKLCRPPMASSEPGRMIAFAPFQGFIRGMSDKMVVGSHTSSLLTARSVQGRQPS